MSDTLVPDLDSPLVAEGVSEEMDLNSGVTLGKMGGHLMAASINANFVARIDGRHAKASFAKAKAASDRLNVYRFLTDSFAAGTDGNSLMHASKMDHLLQRRNVPGGYSSCLLNPRKSQNMSNTVGRQTTRQDV